MKVLTLGLVCLLVGAVASNLFAAEKVAGSSQAEEAVREALQREVYGLNQDRERLLSAALTVDPDHAKARWQAGYVRSRGGWAKVGKEFDTKRQALLEEYRAFRLGKRDVPEEQLVVANWCAEHRLLDQERAHLQRVCQLAPDHEAARARLGFIRRGTEWVSREDQARQEQAKEALELWTDNIEKILTGLSANKPQIRRNSLEQLKQIRDPAAIPALQAVLAKRNEEMELLGVEIVAQISGPEAATSLARQAVLSDSFRVRKLAASKLASYDQETYVPLLVASLYTPVTTQYNAFLRGGQINYHHQLVREGLTQREMMVVDAGYRNASSGNQAEAKAAAFNSAAETAKQLENDAERQNEFTKTMNERIAGILRTATGAELRNEPEAWWKWWADHNEVFVEGTKPTATTHHTVSFNIADRGLRAVESRRDDSLSNPVQPRYDCFAAGTPVWTEQGQVAIEKVRVGDMVLSRNVESGELTYKPVVRTTIRPAGQLTSIRVGKETFETSGGHLFWVSGEGWMKSRDLRSGMVLHTVAGPVRVSDVGTSKPAATYNMVVADFNTYFVGDQQILSHDNTVKRATSRVVPGLVAE